MRMTRKTGVLLTSCAVATVAAGTLGTAAAAVLGERHATPAPAADPAAMVNQLQSLGAVGKVADVLRAAVGTAPDTTRLTQLTRQAKQALDGVTGQSSGVNMTTRVAAPPNQLVMKAAAQTRSSLDALVTAVGSRNTKKIDTAVKGAIQSSVNLAASLVLGNGLPAPTLPGLPKLPQAPGGPAAPGQPAQPGAPAAPGLPETAS